MAHQRSFIRSKLIAQMPKLLSPVVVNAAALVTFTMTLRQASLPPTPFSSEVFFLSESALAQTDPFGVLPVAIGTIAMLNTEVRRRLSILDPEEQKSTGNLFGQAMDAVARTLSVAVIFFAMTNPVVSLCKSVPTERYLTCIAVSLYSSTGSPLLLSQLSKMC